MVRALSTKSPGGPNGIYKIWRTVLSLVSGESALVARVDALESLSETAALTGQVWIDDLPIYRKVIDLGALPNATGKNVAHSIASIGEVISLRGIANNDDTGFAGALPLPSDVIALTIDDTNITVTTASDLTAYDQAYAIVEYTIPE